MKPASNNQFAKEVKLSLLNEIAIPNIIVEIPIMISVFLKYVFAKANFKNTGTIAGIMPRPINKNEFKSNFVFSLRFVLDFKMFTNCYLTFPKLMHFYKLVLNYHIVVSIS